MTRTPADRQALALRMQDDYYAGATIRGIARKEQLSYGTVHTLLLSVDTKLRKRGGRKRVKQPPA